MDRCFRFSAIAMAVIGAAVAGFACYESKASGVPGSLDSIFYIYIIIVSLLAAVLCSLFIGVEYSNGTIRNKISVGHSRAGVYFSNLILCFSASLILCAVNIGVMCAIAVPIAKAYFEMPAEIVAFNIASGAALILALNSFYVMVAMLCPSRAITAVINVLSFFALLIIAITIVMMLNENQQYIHYEFDPSGQLVAGDYVDNPNYVGGVKRDILEFLFAFLPTGQAIRIMLGEVYKVNIFPVYSLIIAFLTSLTGFAAFRKKELK